MVYHLQHPNTPIFISKIGFYKAYRHAHVSASLAAASCFTFDKIGGINLRMNFGKKGHPSGFSTISDTACNVSNTLLNSRRWNVTTLFPRFINVPSTSRLLHQFRHVPSVSILPQFFWDILMVTLMILSQSVLPTTTTQLASLLLSLLCLRLFLAQCPLKTYLVPILCPIKS